MYYRWSKAFLDAGKNGLTRETLRDATTEEVRALKEENASLKKALAKLDISPSTYYRWRHRFRAGEDPVSSRPQTPRERIWNQLLPEERAKITGVALLYPEWSSREMSCYVGDSYGFTVS